MYTIYDLAYTRTDAFLLCEANLAYTLYARVNFILNTVLFTFC